MKRAFDLIVSSLALVVLSPVLPIIALLIKLDSPGPILFLQQRIGQHKQSFQIFKFRSMTHRPAQSIKQGEEAVIEAKDDIRITRVGKLIRATSLDELPQILNIIKGDMSLVGPRPIIPEQLEVVPPHYQGRFEVKPGITGLAQVRGRRSLSWEEQLIADNEYAERHSFLKDIGIMFQTVWVVLARKGIYGDASKNWRAYRTKWGQASTESSDTSGR